MAYYAKYLTLMAHGAGHRWWSYRTADTPAAVDTAGYFTGEAVAMLKAGDLIFVQQVDNPAAPASVVAADWHLVLSKDRKSTRLNSSHYCASRMPSSA